MTTRTKSIFLQSISIGLLAFAGSSCAIAQTDRQGQALPDAPAANLLAQAGVQARVRRPRAVSPQTSTQATYAPAGQRLTRSEAEQMAIKSNPQLSVSRLLALAQPQVVREVRSAELPTANAALTAVDA